MLIITRRPGEKVMLGDDIVLHVMEIVGNSVRIGIEAPRSLRSTARRSGRPVREENRAAARVSPDSLPAAHAARLTNPTPSSVF
jgi:carbon storage regulator